VAISGNREEANKKRAASAGANDSTPSRHAPRSLSRIQNLLRLVRTSRDLEASQAALAQSVNARSGTGT